MHPGVIAWWLEIEIPSTATFMSSVHMAPEEAVRAHEILGAKTSVAIHHGTFQLADDGIDTPEKQLWLAGETIRF
jgi:L-ascorbate metabolism protein UlaG (beta-lactamase superfamily)